MKKNFVIAGLIFSFILLIVSNAPSYDKERLIPTVKVEKDTIVITLSTISPITNVKLFVSYEDEVSRGLKAFPEYRYMLVSKNESASTHQFELPLVKNEKIKGFRAVPLNVVTHFRLSGILIEDKKLTPVRSRDYTFRIIKSASGEYKPGLCFTRSPVVTNVYDDRASICWETNMPAQTRFIYWHEGQREPAVIESKDLLRRVELSLSGLVPDTRYYYVVECLSPELSDEFRSPRFSFKSATLKPHFTFAVMGDSRANVSSIDPDANVNGVNVDELSRLARMAYISGARFILFSGDLISGYSSDIPDVQLQYATWCDSLAPVNAQIPIYPSMGNHDASAPWYPATGSDTNMPFAETIWADVFTLPENGPLAPGNTPTYKENVYSFNYGNCHFVCLNTNYKYYKDYPKDNPLYHTIDEIQRQWLEADLKANLDKKFIFVFFHEPAYPTSVHLNKSLDRLQKERDAVWQIFDKYNVDAVFCGHEHLYSRLLIDKSVDSRWQNSIWQITAGRAGAPWYPLNRTVKWRDNIKAYSYATHFVRVEINGNKARCKTYDIDGNVIDEFELKKKQRNK
ncbi:MAG: metallophosphoesterase family protein [Candidatus Sumerlaeia bacterium]|nr:metallophosphoesterase family protein [Candidatus Sumerlaeia bacterium]